METVILARRERKEPIRTLHKLCFLRKSCLLHLTSRSILNIRNRFLWEPLDVVRVRLKLLLDNYSPEIKFIVKGSSNMKSLYAAKRSIQLARSFKWQAKKPGRGLPGEGEFIPEKEMTGWKMVKCVRQYQL